MAVKYNKEQLEAIYASGQNILVSASAGSGKTTVLIERLINKIKNERIDVDQLLVVTFTEASAKEMKQRLRVKLIEAMQAEPLNAHLKRQLIRLPNANISTFHAFCNRIIKKYFYLIDVESKYQIAKDIELFLVQDDVMEMIFDTLYEQQDEQFLLLVDRFTRSRSDDELKSLISKLYNNLRNIPSRKQFIAHILQAYQVDDDLTQFIYYDAVFKDAQAIVKRAEQHFKTANMLSRDPMMDHAYQTLFELDNAIIEKLTALIDKQAFDALYSYLQDVSFPRFNSKASDHADDDVKQLIKSLRDQGKDLIQNKLKKDLFTYRAASQVKYIKENKPVIEALLYLVDVYEAAYKKAKRDRGWVDFNDLEEYALAILSVNDGENEAVNDYQNLFNEILVDEYQDTNSMQESIITKLSRGHNVFTVGDVKQSIYRFRNAEPEIFQGKYDMYSKDENSSGRLINLNANYRSRVEVIDFINYLFYQIMDKEVGEITYDTLAELKAGAKESYPQINANLIELSIIDQEAVAEQEEDDYSKIEVEAHHVAQKIRQLFDEGALVYEYKRNEMRPLQYKDIVILSRSIKNEQAVFNDVFKQYNIPLLVTDVMGYFDSIEVLTMTSLLEVIDNPLQDIPLVAVLRSPLYQIREKELVAIYACSKEHLETSPYFFDKLKTYIMHGDNHVLVDKLQFFMNQLNQYREMVRNHNLTELLSAIYHETNYYDFVKGQLGGRQRQANLDLLFDRAREYEELSSNSLYKFVQLIGFLKENEKDLEQARTVSENEDLVRIMSIHKSKGLEFPFVFVVNLNKKYNMQDLTQAVLFDKTYGMTCSYFDLQYRVEYETIYQNLMKEEMRDKLIAEEMRLLYVALTRAKERLFLVGSVKNPHIYIMKYSDIWYQEEVLIDASLRLTNTYLDLVLMALMRHPLFVERYQQTKSKVHLTALVEPTFSFEVIDSLNFNPVYEKATVETVKQTGKWHKQINERLFFTYPYIEKAHHFAKMNISDIKRMNQASTYSYDEHQGLYKTPQFIQRDDAMARGTTYHRFMQHIDYKKDYTDDMLMNLKHQLVKQEILTYDEIEHIDERVILNYLNKPFVKQMKDAQFILKERPFTTLMPANRVYPSYPHQDDVLVQGVMDLIVGFENRVYLIDFKTDRIKNTEEAKQQIKHVYQTQINYYEQAVKALYPTKEVKSLLYLFQINDFIPMND